MVKKRESVKIPLCYVKDNFIDSRHICKLRLVNFRFQKKRLFQSLLNHFSSLLIPSSRDILHYILAICST